MGEIYFNNFVIANRTYSRSISDKNKFNKKDHSAIFPKRDIGSSQASLILFLKNAASADRTIDQLPCESRFTLFLLSMIDDSGLRRKRNITIQRPGATRSPYLHA